MNTRRRTLYTAVGHFRSVTTKDGAYPVVLVNRQEYQMDPQEMTVWSILNWRLVDAQGVEEHYEPMFQTLRLEERRTLEHCLGRLVTRGPVAEGRGETDLEALYDLLAGLYVVPISESMPLRTATFFKLLLLDGVPFARAKRIFQKVRLSEGEARVMDLARLALLSTAELIRSVAASFANGQVDVVEHNDQYYFVVKFVSVMGVPPNIDDLTAAINEIKPAHLSLVYEYLFRQWGLLKPYTWGQLATRTWKDLREGQLP